MVAREICILSAEDAREITTPSLSSGYAAGKPSSSEKNTAVPSSHSGPWNYRPRVVKYWTDKLKQFSTGVSPVPTSKMFNMF
jgi:hypothetical protein